MLKSKKIIASSLLVGSIFMGYFNSPVQANTDGSSNVGSLYDVPMKSYSGYSLYEFGAMTHKSGYTENIQLAQSIPNRTTSVYPVKSPKIAMIGNRSDDGKTFSYGTGTAIGYHTLITNAHVVQKSSILKPYDTQYLSQLFVEPKRTPNDTPAHLKVTKVDMIEGSDLALVHTKENLKSYLPIYELESEQKIKDVKNGNMRIKMQSYSYHPTDKYKDSPRFTAFESNGFYLNNGNNIHPVNYLKIAGSGGGSGAALIDMQNKVVGVFAASYNSSVAKDSQFKGGYSLTGDTRKQVENKTY